MRSLIITTYIGIFVQLIDHVGCSVSCHFDTGLCGWTPKGSSKYAWQTLSGESKDRTSGPFNDVTCKNFNGYYAYLPGMYSSKGIKSEMESEAVALNKTSALSFWYFMNGVGIGSLVVVQKFDNKTVIELLSKHGEQFGGWQQAKVSLLPGTFTVLIRGSADLPYGSDLAIDDVALESENIDFDTSYCFQTTTTLSTTYTSIEAKAFSSGQPSEATKSTKTSASKSHIASWNTLLPVHYSTVCSATVSKSMLLPGSCDFENSTCDLDIRKNEHDEEVSWERINNGKPLLKASIQHDHTYQNASANGYFLNFRNKVKMFRFDKTPNGRNASVETPLYDATVVCLSFWYIMTTIDSNLLVYMKDISGNTFALWTTNTTTSDWTQKQIHIQSAVPFKIGFQTRNKNFQAIVGIDDIEIKAGLTKSFANVTAKPSSDLLNTVTTEPATSRLSPDIRSSFKIPLSVSTSPSSLHKQASNGFTHTALGTVTQIRIDGKGSSNNTTSTESASALMPDTQLKSTQSQTTRQFTTSASADISTEQTPIASSPLDNRPGLSVTHDIITQINKLSMHNSTVESHVYTHKPSLFELTDAANGQPTSSKQPMSLGSTNQYSSTSTHKNQPANLSLGTELFTGPVLSTIQPSSTSSGSTRENISSVKDKKDSHKYRNSVVVIGYSVGSLAFITVIALIIYFTRKYLIERKVAKRHSKMLHSNGFSQNVCTDSATQNGNLTESVVSHDKGTSKMFPELLNETNVSTRF